MKTSKHILSKTQCAIFATLLVLSTLSLGCNDNIIDSPPPVPTPEPTLEGTWIAVGDNNNVLGFSGSSGFHSVNPEDINADKVYIEFLYKKLSTSMLRITMTKNSVNGANLPVSEEEDVYYQINNGILLIFGQKYFRAYT